MKENEKSVSISCRWCVRVMPPITEFARGVCADCYRLLTGAGISDEEIFAELDE